jgi:hypothetical protein
VSYDWSMSPVRFASIAALVLVTSGCAENVANRCPGTTVPRCLSGLVCEEDKDRGCQVCRCETPYQVPVTQAPQGSPQPLPE